MRKIAIFLIVVLFLPACLGYQFRGYGNNLPADIKTVAIIPFDNHTYESMVETYMVNSLINEFSRSKWLKVVGEKDADLVISGAVLSVSTNSISYSGDDRAYEYRVRVKIEVEARDIRQDVVIWQNDSMSEVEEYHTSGVPNDVQIQKRMAIQKICKVLAENVHDRLLTDF
ncbi:MAG: LptE family protein [Deltaproteobacteria bacterium]|nr:LptE family protein [Candidatus Tharpellaceae bacterium]